MDPAMVSLANIYAQALLDTAESVERGEELADGLGQLISLLNAQPDLEQLLAAALISTPQRIRLVQRIFADRIDQTLEAFLVNLARHGRLGMLRGIARSFRALLNVREGKKEAYVTSAVPLDEQQREQVRHRLSEIFGA